MIPKIPKNEAERQSRLNSYEILDTASEQQYDDIVKITSAITGKPIALVSLVDKERQWFKAKLGIDLSESPRQTSFCGHAINHPDQVLEIKDTTLDPRFLDNPFVTHDPKIRYYAGAPLVTPDGYAIGTLCVLDTKPGQLNEAERQALEALARKVIAELELRASHRQIETQLALLSRTQAELIQQAKFASIGVLSSGISHEINNPLGIIFGHCERLNGLIRGGQIASALQSTDKVEKAAKRISDIVKSLSRIAKGKSGSKGREAVDFNEFLSDLKNVCATFISDKGIDFKIITSNEDVLLNIEHGPISLILLNLISNAVDAVEHGTQKEVRLTASLKNNDVLFEVFDSGEGIPEEIQDKIMDPFFTTKEVGRGSGLGLTISQSLANIHGAELGFETSHTGTSFTLKIPNAVVADQIKAA